MYGRHVSHLISLFFFFYDLKFNEIGLAELIAYKLPLYNLTGIENFLRISAPQISLKKITAIMCRVS